MPRALLAVIVALSAATGARTQEVPRRQASKFEIRAQLGYLHLYGGDATVGSVSTWMPSVGLGYRLPLSSRVIVIEASAAHVGQDYDPYNRAPAFTFLGALLRSALTSPDGRRVEPFVTIGVGRWAVDAEEIVCEPPCFSEGGPNFRDGTFTVLVVGGGAVVPVMRWNAIRGDVRLFVPRNTGNAAGDSDDVRFELAAGVVLRR